MVLADSTLQSRNSVCLAGLCNLVFSTEPITVLKAESDLRTRTFIQDFGDDEDFGDDRRDPGDYAFRNSVMRLVRKAYLDGQISKGKSIEIGRQFDISREYVTTLLWGEQKEI